MLRRLSTVPGVVQVNSWGGPTKEFEVEVDPHKLQAYNITIPQIITALGNANINVGGREISIGQQSINIRGVGLIDDGGNDDLTKGYSVADIENVVLAQTNGVPVLVKDVAKVLRRLRAAARHRRARITTTMWSSPSWSWAEPTTPTTWCRESAPTSTTMNHDGSLPPGVKIVPYLRPDWPGRVTTHTVLHNLIFGCLLVFFIQWIFLGDLRSADHRRRQHSLRAVLRHHHAGAARRGCQSAVGRRGRLRHHRRFGRDPGGEIFRNFQATAATSERSCSRIWPKGSLARIRPIHTVRRAGPRLDRPVAPDLGQRLQVDRAVLFSAAITVAAFVPLFTMQGVEGQIFGPMARTYGYALAGALIATFTVTPVLASIPAARTCEGGRDRRRAGAAPRLYAGAALGARARRTHGGRIGVGFLAARGRPGDAPRQRVPAGPGGGQLLDPRVDAADA